MSVLSSILPVSRKRYQSLQLAMQETDAINDAKLRKVQRQLDMLKVREFKGAGQTRLTQYIDASHQGINKDIQAQGRELLARARDLTKNTSAGRRFQKLYITNVIGANGHIVQPDASETKVQTSATGEAEVTEIPDVVANMKLAEAWEEWTKRGNCTMNGRHSFGQFSKLLGVSKLRDGEAFVYKVIDPTAKHPLKLQMIPPEAVAYELNQRLPNGNVVIMGVELDSWWRPVAYYLSPTRPKDELYGLFGYRRDYTRVPAADILHWYDQEYMEQTRGVTMFAAVMLDMFDVQEYDDATVKNAILSARKLGFLKNREGVEPKPLKGDGRDEDGNIIIEGDAGSFSFIEDYELQQMDPQFPQAQYEPFDRVKSRKISGALGAAYSAMANDYSQGSYSSHRREQYTERDNYIVEQVGFQQEILLPLYEQWLQLNLLAGNIKLPSFKYDKFKKVTVLGPRWISIDPGKDVDADKQEVGAGFTSPYDIAARKGDSLEKVYRDIAAAQKLAKKYNITLDWGSKPKAAEPEEPAPANKPAAAEEGEDDDTKKPAKRAEVPLAEALAGNSNGNGHS